jgi:hypothetical protein
MEVHFCTMRFAYFILQKMSEVIRLGIDNAGNLVLLRYYLPSLNQSTLFPHAKRS